MYIAPANKPRLMKKALTYLGLVSIACSCMSEPDYSFDPEFKLDYVATPEEIHEIEYEVQIEGEDTLKTSQIHEYHAIFNRKGRIETSREYTRDGFFSSYEKLTYTFHGNLKKIKFYNHLDSLQGMYVYSFNRKERQITIHGYDSKKNLDYKEIAVIDAEGNWLESMVYDPVSPKSKSAYAHDDQNRLILKTYSSGDFLRTDTIRYVYNSAGFTDSILHSKDYVDPNLFKYIYDDKGNWIKKLTYELRTITRIEYKVHASTRARLSTFWSNLINSGVLSSGDIGSREYFIRKMQDPDALSEFWETYTSNGTISPSQLRDSRYGFLSSFFDDTIHKSLDPVLTRITEREIVYD